MDRYWLCPCDVTLLSPAIVYNSALAVCVLRSGSPGGRRGMVVMPMLGEEGGWGHGRLGRDGVTDMQVGLKIVYFT